MLKRSNVQKNEKLKEFFVRLDNSVKYVVALDTPACMLYMCICDVPDFFFFLTVFGIVCGVRISDILHKLRSYAKYVYE